MSLLVGLDVGTTGAKGVLVRDDGTVVATRSSPYGLSTPRPGWTEQDPVQWWDASAAVLRVLAGATREPIAAVGLTGQMHGAVFLDDSGTVIRPALLWNDQRTARECQELESAVGAARLREITGNAALTGFQAPKILWLRNNEPWSYRRVAHVLLPKDYIRFRLTGEFATDASDASGTLLFDLTSRNWSSEIVDALEIPDSWLPRVHEGPEVTGMISVKAAHETGLTPATWVVAGAGDNAAAAVGAGVIGNGDALLSVGTSGVIFAHCYSPLVDPTGAIQAFAHAMHRRYHVMGVMLAAGGSLRWCRDTIAAGSDYDQLIAEASRASPGSDGAIFLPYLCGERTPHMNPFARAGWFGLTLAHGRAQIVRSVLEGVAFGLLDSLVRIEELGIRITALRAVGNGLDNPVWRRIVCDVLNRPLSRPVVEEGPAFGAAVLASVGSGIHASVNAAVTEMVHVSDVPDEPNPSTHAIYEASYERFCDMYLALLPFMDEEQACPV